ncbi:hypothetical protein [Dokdonella sp.]|uniref:hypothetical protein n=1 Tax=Dokdonella sp. TaxID=2291710 RepID=UPI0025BA4D6B|nr:hypothetical protein [Dokdonella sp.]MBX3692087.1 hypothetical protein [Dokdonella sp.]MCW5566953.1 hypothetical protein [Dokdonella sp.]
MLPGSFKAVVPVLFLCALGSSTASAQGAFAGSWRVVDSVRPDWIEPTSPEPVAPLKQGDMVTFKADAVIADSYLGCRDATYEVLTVAPEGLFQGGVVDGAQLASARDRFGLSAATTTLRVDCDQGVFDYHQGGKGLVIQFDNMVYVLERAGR